MRSKTALAVLVGGTLACAGPTLNLPGLAPRDAEPTAELEPPPIPEPLPANLLPLAVGHRWTWRLVERRGAGMRFMLIGTQPATTETLERWSLEIVGRDERDRFSAQLVRAPVGGLASTTEITLWDEGGQTWMEGGDGKNTKAIEANIPPGALSTERVPCIAHVLGGYAGTCAPVPGGPTGAPAGVEYALVSHPVSLAATGQVLIGLMTAGIIIPGDRTPARTLELEEWRPATEQAERYAAKRSPLLEATEDVEPDEWLGYVERYGADPESIAVLLTKLTGDELISVAGQLVPRLAQDGRHAVARVLVQQQRDRDDRIWALAVVLPYLDTPTPEPHRTAMLAQFPDEEERSQAESLLQGAVPLFAAVIIGTGDSKFDDRVVAALNGAVDDHPVTRADAVAIVQRLTFDDKRRAAIAVLVNHAQPADRGPILLATFPQLRFDDGRVEVLQDHAELARSLSATDRQRLYGAVKFSEGRARAREILGL